MERKISTKSKWWVGLVTVSLGIYVSVLKTDIADKNNKIKSLENIVFEQNVSISNLRKSIDQQNESLKLLAEDATRADHNMMMAHEMIEKIESESKLAIANIRKQKPRSCVESKKYLRDISDLK